jgi:lysozyme family protein
VSSLSTPQNTLIRHKPKEINLREKWHSSYASPDKIEDVEIKKARSPATAPGFFSFGQSIQVLKGRDFIPAASVTRSMRLYRLLKNSRFAFRREQGASAP